MFPELKSYHAELILKSLAAPGCASRSLSLSVYRMFAADARALQTCRRGAAGRDACILLGCSVRNLEG
jgi:hypothetical protein